MAGDAENEGGDRVGASVADPDAGVPFEERFGGAVEDGCLKACCIDDAGIVQKGCKEAVARRYGIGFRLAEMDMIGAERFGEFHGG